MRNKKHLPNPVHDMMADAAKNAATKKKNGEPITPVEQAALDWLYDTQPPRVVEGKDEKKERTSIAWLVLTVSAIILAFSLSMLASAMAWMDFISLF